MTDKTRDAASPVSPDLPETLRNGILDLLASLDGSATKAKGTASDQELAAASGNYKIMAVAWSPLRKVEGKGK